VADRDPDWDEEAVRRSLARRGAPWSGARVGRRWYPRRHAGEAVCGDSFAGTVAGAAGIRVGTLVRGLATMVVRIDEQEYLTAVEACALLGVKPQTLYAYVSRGILRSYRQGMRRRRLYLRRDVEALVRLRPGGRRGGGRALRLPLPPAEEWIWDR
jgi:excisionase family DNA binding protein